MNDNVFEMLEFGETEGELEEERRGAAWGGGYRGGHSRGGSFRGPPMRFGASVRQPRLSPASWPRPYKGSPGWPPGPGHPKLRPRWPIRGGGYYPLAFVPQPSPSDCVCPPPAPCPQGP